jgi:hypothetical protein
VDVDVEVDVDMDVNVALTGDVDQNVDVVVDVAPLKSRMRHCQIWHCQTTLRSTAEVPYEALTSLAPPNCHPWHCQLWHCQTAIRRALLKFRARRANETCPVLFRPAVGWLLRIIAIIG